MENETTRAIPEAPAKQTRQLPLNKFTVGGAAILAIILIAIGAASAGGTPEPEVRTITKTERIEGATIETEVLPEQCQEALALSLQNMVDFNNLVGDIGDAIVTFSETYESTQFEPVLERQQVVIAEMLDATKAALDCDPTLKDKIDLE